jgi:hypothetical protein
MTESDPAETLRVERDRERPVRHTEAGRIAIPLSVFTGPAGTALPAEMVLPGDEAEILGEQIAALINRRAPLDATPGGGRREDPQASVFDGSTGVVHG